MSERHGTDCNSDPNREPSALCQLLLQPEDSQHCSKCFLEWGQGREVHGTSAKFQDCCVCSSSKLSLPRHFVSLQDPSICHGLSHVRPRECAPNFPPGTPLRHSWGLWGQGTLHDACQLGILVEKVEIKNGTHHCRAAAVEGGQTSTSARCPSLSWRTCAGNAQTGTARQTAIDACWIPAG